MYLSYWGGPVGVNERLGQQRGKEGDTAEEVQSSKTTAFVYAS